MSPASGVQGHLAAAPSLVPATYPPSQRPSRPLLSRTVRRPLAATAARVPCARPPPASPALSSFVAVELAAPARRRARLVAVRARARARSRRVLLLESNTTGGCFRLPQVDGRFHEDVASRRVSSR
jgi:hypothetical protein